ncbi:MAG: fibronectin type III domain-containing protein [Eubacteriales bacterium]|nr:fibronectin type III domain-containing protein [Eubacteriales bacterium]
MKKAAALFIALCLSVQAICASPGIIMAADFEETGIYDDENPGTEEQPGSTEDMGAESQDGQTAENEDPQNDVEIFENNDTGENDSLFQSGEDMAEEPLFGDGTEESEEAFTDLAENSGTGNGSLKVELLSAVTMANDRNFSVELTNSGNQTITIPAASEGGIPSTSAYFPGLQAGDYTLTINSQGFAPYKQSLTVEAMDYSIQVYTGMLAGVDYNAAGHPGAMLIGDINGDGMTDSLDKDIILQTIENGSGNINADLNLDGTVDLMDLHYFAKGLEQTTSYTSSVLASVPVQAAQKNVSEGTQITGGNLENLGGNNLSESERTVQLAASNNAVISQENPVEVAFDFSNSAENPPAIQGITLESPAGSNNAVTTGTITVIVDDGTDTGYPIEVPFSPKAEEAVYFLMESSELSSPTAVVDKDGTIVIDFHGQIAVKKVTIKITGTKLNTSLAEVSEVTFVNNMQDRIPAPQMNIPVITSITAGSQQFTLEWNQESNVTGYEVQILHGDEDEIKKTSATSMTVKSFKNDKLKNNETYEISVQSVNGEWRSGYCTPKEVIPKTTQVPDAPDNLKVTGGYKSLAASWKNMKDTDSYNLYYRKDTDSVYNKIENITGNSYTVSQLEDNTRYFVYVTGVNEKGEGKPSLKSVAVTTSLASVKMPEYKLINTSKGEGQLSAHIKSITHGRGKMLDSPLDDASEIKNSAYGVADNNQSSSYYMNDWDDGAYYPSIDGKGLIITLDAVYQIGGFSFVDSSNQGSYNKIVLDYWDEHNAVKSVNTSISRKLDTNGKAYYYVKFNKPVEASKFHIGIGKPNAYIRSIQVSDLNLFYYDSLETDIINLYEDDLHTMLKETVTAETIQELQNRLDTRDSVSGEFHPEKEMLQKELDTAKGILEGNLKSTVGIHGEIRNSDGYLGFTGLNAWQPLGVSARAGETITVFVGHSTKKTGTSAEMKLFVTQNHAEASSFAKEIATLNVGRNEVTIPSIQSIAAEQGGQLYVQYTGGQNGISYGVRVNGGAEIPRLDLYRLSESERADAILKYVQELEAFVPELEKQHKELHQKGDLSSVNYDYDAKNCILNTTDIMLDQMMYSVPASQVLAGLGSGSTQEKAEKLNQALKAMDDMMLLFYQHKGLTNASDAGAKNKLPARHLNIRYMRMFSGAFMYASGNHVGIEWGSVTGLMSGTPIVSNNGRYESGRYFGWGIAHEIGHEINQGSYAIAEITNNYFSVLAQAHDTNDTVRFKYKDVYEKVTSGTVGRADNVFVQLALYWQLHLAYDRGYNYKTYDTYEDIFNNLFFARVDSYARDTSKAPSPGGVKLTLSDTDQNLMRLAAAAAEKDLTEFFQRWGMVPDEATKAYMNQFEAEERAIYYVNDEARVYEIENGTESTFKDKNIVNASVETHGTKAELSLSVSGNNSSALLGYEIYRCTNAKGTEIKELAAFTTENTYTDTAISQANRVVTYEVAAVDKFLNRSASYRLAPVKIASDGRYAKAGWTVNTNNNLKTDEDKVKEPDEENPDIALVERAIDKVIDNDSNSTFTGSSSGNGEIILDFHKTLPVSALLYEWKDGTTPIKNYRIQLSKDGSKWFTVKEGQFQTDNTDTAVVYFQNEKKDPFVCTFDAQYLKLQILDSGERSVSELEILGPSGDNLEFRKDAPVGILKEDYVYASDKTGVQKIPEGSLVFTGTYKGNPAYNVAVLYDENGNVVGGTDSEGNLKSEQIILAEVPEHGELGEVSEGNWIYYVLPDSQGKFNIPKQVRAELYRVDNALTNEGERLVSDTLYLTIPEKLPEITFNTGEGD